MKIYDKYSNQINQTEIRECTKLYCRNFSVLLTEYHGTFIVKHQLDAQILYFLIILQSCTCFEQYYAHPQEVELYKHSIWCDHCL
jgi:tRNA(Ser,Leu) C12 N-acetylase TAN1